MNHEHFVSTLKSSIDLQSVNEGTDIELLVLYLKLGNMLTNYIKANNLDKNKTLSSIFNQLKTEFYQIQIYNLKAIKALCFLAADYNKLAIIKELLKKIATENKILIVQGVCSAEEMIVSIKNSINKSLYIDKYTRLYYYSQLEKNQSAETNFRETIKLLSVFERI